MYRRSHGWLSLYPYFIHGYGELSTTLTFPRPIWLGGLFGFWPYNISSLANCCNAKYSGSVISRIVKLLTLTTSGAGVGDGDGSGVGVGIGVGVGVGVDVIMFSGVVVLGDCGVGCPSIVMAPTMTPVTMIKTVAAAMTMPMFCHLFLAAVAVSNCMLSALIVFP
jgi:hypothetical protein